MIDWKAYAEFLLEEFDLCIKAKPMHDAINVQLEKDAVAKVAYRLNNIRAWGTDTEIEQVCLEFSPKLDELKKKLVFNILRNSLR